MSITLVGEDRQPTTGEPLAGSDHHGAVPARVLIADDDRAIREALARALELEGYDVVAVVDGVEALSEAHCGRFDSLVLDVMMPGIDGLAVCRVLRAEGDRTPVLMLTARIDHTTIYERIWGYDFGADSKNLAVYIGYLRRKLTAAGAPTLIHTVRGVGYTVRR